MPAPLPLTSVNHIARSTRDLSKLDETIRFYRDVLGFRSIKRPNFSFPGAWLYGYGLQIHLIIDEQAGSLPEDISTRADHVALHTADIEGVARALDERGIKYVRNYVPDRDVTQIFFHDPNGYHIEIGNYPAGVEYLDPA
ncbi:MAG: VOC family protein [Pirellulales bacterium]|nr:VOC family protein [Pirellulales bacterium]